MNIPPINLLDAPPTAALQDLNAARNEDAAKAPEQFEAILLRQFLSESMKPLLQEGQAGQVYGYLLTDALAGSIASAGGLGLCSVLQAQLGNDRTHAEP